MRFSSVLKKVLITFIIIHFLKLLLGSSLALVNIIRSEATIFFSNGLFFIPLISVLLLILYFYKNSKKYSIINTLVVITAYFVLYSSIFVLIFNFNFVTKLYQTFCKYEFFNSEYETEFYSDGMTGQESHTFMEYENKYYLSIDVLKKSDRFYINKETYIDNFEGTYYLYIPEEDGHVALSVHKAIFWQYPYSKGYTPLVKSTGKKISFIKRTLLVAPFFIIEKLISGILHSILITILVLIINNKFKRNVLAPHGLKFRREID